MIEAAIFDCDGTLVDSETLSLQVLVDYAAELGLQLTHDEAMQRFAGTNLSLVFAELQDRMFGTLPLDHVEEFRRRQIKVLRADLKEVEGAASLLGAMRLPFCVASNAPQKKIRVCLDTTGLRRYFEEDAIHSAYDIDRWKPDPGLFLRAADQLGVPSSRCAVVEDSRPGVEAGLAANMQVFALDPKCELRQVPELSGEHGNLRFIDSLVELNSHFT
ncbi:MAG: HAD-IA family hydrolase [Planctomycetota bacterium]